MRKADLQDLPGSADRIRSKWDGQKNPCHDFSRLENLEKKNTSNTSLKQKICGFCGKNASLGWNIS